MSMIFHISTDVPTTEWCYSRGRNVHHQWPRVNVGKSHERYQVLNLTPDSHMVYIKLIRGTRIKIVGVSK